MAAQALLKYELTRLGPSGRKTLTENWALFLPTSLDPTLSIFVNAAICGSATSSSVTAAHSSPSPQPPPIPPRGKTIPLPDFYIQDLSCEYATGVQQVRRNQATAIILLGVVAAEFPEEMNKMELSRDTALCLLELLVSPSTDLLPLVSPLRRAAIDLIGRGFAAYQPHLDISKVLLGLLDLASSNEKFPGDYGPVLPPAVDACRTARHALSLIATSRPPALITALSKEVTRYNSAAQHQTIQHTVTSPLLKSRNEVLYLIEILANKQYSDVADLIIPVGEILVHCLDTSLLKHKTLAEIFPPITGFYMVAYCANTRRIAFGGRNGAVVVHELRASKTLQAHQSAVTALSFSDDGKYLATYSAQDGKISFWQTTQTFLGMGQSQMKCVRTHPAPTLFPITGPDGTLQPFKARLVWISGKSVTLMLPNGNESRFGL
uniref:WD_REPEATS_REGION domain-containing protein n=1 Tax=Syphacia muris TaxID=451379 RepID=A0A0N5A9D2_9BILA